MVKCSPQWINFCVFKKDRHLGILYELVKKENENWLVEVNEEDSLEGNDAYKLYQRCVVYQELLVFDQLKD